MKKSVLAVLLFLCCSSLKAQVTFQFIYGDTSYNDIQAVTQTIDRNYAVLGSKIFQGDTLSDILLTKVDSFGIPVFSVRDSTPFDDYGYDFKETPDNGFIITGSTFGSPIDPDSADIILIKTDQTGIVQWANAYGGFGNDIGYSVSLSYDDGYFISGYTNSGPAVYNQGFAMKVDFNGTPLWYRADSLYHDSHFNDGCGTVDSGFVAAGCTVDTSGSKDLFAVKYNNNGDILWSKRFLATGNQDAHAVTGTADGGCILAGTHSADSTLHSTDMLVLKLDSSGAVEWSRSYNHLFEDGADDIIQLNNGQFVVSGFSNVTDTTAPVKLAVFLELNASGDTLNSGFFGDPQKNNRFNSVSLTPDGGLILAGQTFGFGKANGTAFIAKMDSAREMVLCPPATALFSSATLTFTDSSGSSVDTLLPIYSSFNVFTNIFPVTSQYSFSTYCFSLLSEGPHSVTAMNVYPNPVQHTLNIDLGTADSRFETLVIFDVFGRTVLSKKIDAAKSIIQLDTEKFKPGIYQVELRGQQDFASRKFVKVD